MNLSNSHIIVTGAASGIGRAFLWELLHFENSTILVADINEESLAEALQSLPKNSHRWILLPVICP